MKQTNKDIAIQLDRAAKEATAVSQISAEQAISLEDAYEIQKLSIDERLRRGEILVGIKLGFTSVAKMEQMGVHEVIWGRLTDTMQYESGAEIDLSKFIHPRAEPEIAFLLKRDITHPIMIQEIPEYIEEVAAAIELIDSRYQNFKFSLEDVVADNCSSSAFIIGDWHKLNFDISKLKMDLRINGKIVQSGNASSILDDPLNSIVEASRILEKYGENLKAGMILLAGAATAAEYIHPGDLIESRVEQFATINFKCI